MANATSACSLLSAKSATARERFAGRQMPSYGSKYLINGEPTENQLALGSKGALRFEIVARGRMAHSAYPELGESAIEKLLNALERIRKLPLPVDANPRP